MRNRSPWRPSGAVFGFLLLLSACTEYRQIAPADVAGFSEVRVTTPDVDRMSLHEPSVEGDALRGYPSEAARLAADLWTVPLDRVTAIEAKQANTVGTVALVGVGVALAAAIISVVDWDDSDTF